MLTLFTSTFAKRRIQCNIDHRTHIKRFRTQTTSAPFRPVYADSQPRVSAWIVKHKLHSPHRGWPLLNTEMCGRKMAALLTFERLVDEGEGQSLFGLVGKLQVREFSAGLTWLRPLDMCSTIIDRLMSQSCEHAAGVLVDTMTAKK